VITLACPDTQTVQLL